MIHRFSWLDEKQTKKATINSINKNDNKSFQYSVKVLLNHGKLKKTPAKNITNLVFYR